MNLLEILKIKIKNSVHMKGERVLLFTYKTKNDTLLQILWDTIEEPTKGTKLIFSKNHKPYFSQFLKDREDYETMESIEKVFKSTLDELNGNNSLIIEDKIIKTYKHLTKIYEMARDERVSPNDSKRLIEGLERIITNVNTEIVLNPQMMVQWDSSSIMNYLYLLDKFNLIGPELIKVLTGYLQPKI